MANTITNQSGLQVIAEDELHQVLFAFGITKPGAVPGYLPGCIFVDSDTGEVYKNAGSVDAASFVEIAALSGGTFSDDVTFADGVNLIAGTTTGTEIGTAADQKLGFFGATPVVQQTALTASVAETIDTTYGQNEADAISNLVTRVDELEAALVALGLIAAA